MMNPLVLISVLSLLLLSACSPSSPPGVIAVYPSSDTLPDNLLRVYVQFSQAMKPFENLEKIKIIHESGEEVPHAIFQNSQELWNAEQTQLTLIFDPSRVKTGLKAHQAQGRALKSGNTYQLQIGQLENSEHVKMTAPYAKSFYVTDSDTVQPTISNWDIETPAANSVMPMAINFSETIDHFSLQSRLTLLDPENSKIKGTVSISDRELRWEFTPAQPWPAGRYRLAVNTRLEDPSGNNLNGLFDHHRGTLKFEREGETLFIPILIDN